MTRILAIIMLAITAGAADIVLYSTVAPTAAYPAMVPQTAQQVSYFAYDDGALMTGVVRPNPVYTIMENAACVRDNMTGLIWARNSNIISNTAWDVDGKVKSWSDGLLAVSNLNATAYGGRTDWRMPNINEMCSLINFRFTSSPFVTDATGTNQWTVARGPWTVIRTDNPGGRYWTSTSYLPSSTLAWYVEITGGRSFSAKTTATLFVWPCAGP